MACPYSLDDADQGIAIEFPCVSTVAGTEIYVGFGVCLTVQHKYYSINNQLDTTITVY